MKGVGFLGIDVSKGYADFGLFNFDKQQLGKSYKCYDNADGHTKMLKRIKVDMAKNNLTMIICGVESTGGYENNWYHDLREREAQGIEVYRLNPRGVKHQGASKLVRTVTDEVSAKLIALQLIENHQEIRSYAKPSIELSQARSFYRTIIDAQKKKTAWNNQLEKLLYTAFPELLTFKNKGLNQWTYRLLSKYEGRENLARKNKSTLLKIKGLSEETVILLKQKAKESIGVESPFLIRAIKQHAGNIIHLEKQIKADKIYLEKNYQSPQVDLISSSIAGIGKYTAIGIMMEVEEVSRFASASKMAAYFGVHPQFKASGDSQGKARMSKQGSSAYRCTIYQAARGVIMHNPYFKEIYAAHRAKGRGHGCTMGILMHKLTKIIFGMLKSNTPFDYRINKQHIDRTINKQKEEKTQEQDTEIKEEIASMSKAPVSQRAIRKMKAQLTPQTSTVEANTRSTIKPKQT